MYLIYSSQFSREKKKIEFVFFSGNSSFYLFNAKANVSALPKGNVIVLKKKEAKMKWNLFFGVLLYQYLLQGSLWNYLDPSPFRCTDNNCRTFHVLLLACTTFHSLIMLIYCIFSTHTHIPKKKYREKEMAKRIKCKVYWFSCALVVG